MGHEGPPPTLYKYLGSTGSKVLTGWSLRFSPPDHLNDPFEVKPPVLPRRRSPFDGRRIQALLPAKRQQELWDRLNATYGLLCLSEDPRNLLLWAHYAAAHEGFVVDLKTDHPSFRALGTLRRVVYRHRRPVVRSLRDTSADLRPLLTKSPHWRYEQEWRVIAPLKEMVVTSQDGLPLFLKKIEPEAVASVYLGTRITAELKDTLRSAISRLSHIGLYQVRLEALTYGISFDEHPDEHPVAVLRHPKGRPLRLLGPSFADGSFGVYQDGAIYFYDSFGGESTENEP